MILLGIVVAAALTMLFGLAVGVRLAREERAALWAALREWRSAEMAVARASYTKRIPAERRLARAESVLRSLVAEEDMDGDARA